MTATSHSLSHSSTSRQASFADIGERFNSYIARAGLFDMDKFELTSQEVEADKATPMNVALE